MRGNNAHDSYHSAISGQLWNDTRVHPVQTNRKHSLFDFIFHSSHSIFVWDQDLMSSTAKVTQDVVSLVVQQDVLNLPTQESDFI